MDPNDHTLVPKGAFWIYRAKEYNTSKRCSRCWQKTDFYHRQQLPDGTSAADILRIKHCWNCGQYFHRDGMAASAIVTIAADALLDGSRLYALCDEKWKTRKQTVRVSNTWLSRKLQLY